ncbi:hypothetical protein CROQUDRAFT_723872 [Cronartium quercuum f. sp. fusiforme G11]|uniref:C2H2-type domain-containing protein n=1 Tax=Cronartium quercuum f. sp. fusiforme G11 TaxID=708437 RepID=A0A9P6TAK9_9BASI|nr:hypothetical protein CROQUDRAFT_723872 [Cronartium quercuum f. sp. fusiforme G11]
MSYGDSLNPPVSDGEGGLWGSSPIAGPLPASAQPTCQDEDKGGLWGSPDQVEPTTSEVFPLPGSPSPAVVNDCDTLVLPRCAAPPLVPSTRASPPLVFSKRAAVPAPLPNNITPAPVPSISNTQPISSTSLVQQQVFGDVGLDISTILSIIQYPNTSAPLPSTAAIFPEASTSSYSQAPFNGYNYPLPNFFDISVEEAPNLTPNQPASQECVDTGSLFLNPLAPNLPPPILPNPASQDFVDPCSLFLNLSAANLPPSIWQNRNPPTAPTATPLVANPSTCNSTSKKRSQAESDFDAEQPENQPPTKKSKTSNECIGPSVKAQTPCTVCGKLLSSKPANMRRHMAAIHGEVKYDCPICGQKLKFQGDVKRHIKLKHSKTSDQPPPPSSSGGLPPPPPPPPGGSAAPIAQVHVSTY